VDPSCSGSGLPEHQLQAETDAAPATAAGARLKRLAAFKRRILPLDAAIFAGKKWVPLLNIPWHFWKKLRFS